MKPKLARLVSHSVRGTHRLEVLGEQVGSSLNSRVRSTRPTWITGQPTGVRDFSGEEFFPGVELSRRIGITSRL